MNKDKAIQLLERLQDPEPYEPMLTKDAYDAIQMAIDALNADGDTISRKAAIEVIDSFNVFESRCDQIKLEQMIGELPPANCSEFPNNSDTISRQAAIEALKNRQDDGKGDISRFYNTIIQHDIEAIEQLPPAQPERIRGRWIETGKYFPNTHWQLVYEVICDKCNGIAYLRKSDKAYIGANICPNCGAEMEVTT